MLWRLVSMDKRPGVIPIGVGETFRLAIANLVMRAAGDQEKTAFGSLQLCAGLESGIEWETHAVAQRRRERDVPDPGGGSYKVSEGAGDKMWWK